MSLQWHCIFAAILQLVTEAVKPIDRRTVRARRTEEQILAAARTLFLEHGYAGTALEAVAHAADVSPRTLYVRFGTKAALLKRVVDVAVAGDTEPVEVVRRDWFQESLTAATLSRRIAAQAAGVTRLLARAAELIAVAEQAAADEPTLAAAHRAARAATHASARLFWGRARQDGLLPGGCDVRWLAPTSTLLTTPAAYLEARRTLEWTDAAYERWVVKSWHRLVTAGS